MAENVQLPPDDMKKRGVEALRSAKSGWQSIMNGNKESRQQRIIKEQEDRARAIREGRPLNEEKNWKPGDDELPSEPVTSRQLMERHKSLLTESAQKKEFKNTPEKLMLLLASLFEEGKIKRVEKIEEAGFNLYKATCI